MSKSKPHATCMTLYNRASRTAHDMKLLPQGSALKVEPAVRESGTAVVVSSPIVRTRMAGQHNVELEATRCLESCINRRAHRGVRDIAPGGQTTGDHAATRWHEDL